MCKSASFSPFLLSPSTCKVIKEAIKLGPGRVFEDIESMEIKKNVNLSSTGPEVMFIFIALSSFPFPLGTVAVKKNLTPKDISRFFPYLSEKDSPGAM